jgi:curved DNA-binding protein CbpA
MPNPFELLEVTPDTTDEVVRLSYLDKIKEHPPDRDPRGFEQVRSAYEQIKDSRARLEFLLFDPACGDTIEDIIKDVQERCLRDKWTLEKIRQLLIDAS